MPALKRQSTPISPYHAELMDEYCLQFECTREEAWAQTQAQAASGHAVRKFNRTEPEPGEPPCPMDPLSAERILVAVQRCVMTAMQHIRPHLSSRQEWLYTAWAELVAAKDMMDRPHL